MNFLVAQSVFQYTSDPAQLVIIDAPIYENRAVFSITANNQLQGTFWAVKDGEQYNFSLLQCDFTILNSSGTPIGIAQTGLTPDSNGYFYMNPVLASPIVDLTHYLVRVTITGTGKQILSTIGLALGE
jgi:hypothetical protein